MRRALILATTALALLAVTPSASAYPPPGLTERLSVSPTGDGANGPSYEASISEHGHYVAFTSFATNLVPGDLGENVHVYVRDRKDGGLERITSPMSSGGTGGGFSPVITPDGRFVAFASYSGDLVEGDTNGVGDVFVHDRATGTTDRVSVASGGSEGNDRSSEPAITPDGRFVAFSSEASNLVPGDENASGDVFVHDRAAGTTELVSVAAAGGVGDSYAAGPALSNDGRFVAFYGAATNLVPGDTNNTTDVFVRDRLNDVMQRVSVTAGGAQLVGSSFEPSLSADGRLVAYATFDGSLVPSDTNQEADVYLHDRTTGGVERISLTTAGATLPTGSRKPMISGDGRMVAFTSKTLTPVAEDDGATPPRSYVHDRMTGVTEVVSAASDGTLADEATDETVLSPDGRYVAFTTTASNLAADDVNQGYDLYLRDRGPSLGAASAAVSSGPAGSDLAGWARFDGAGLAAAIDPPDDGAEGAAVVDGEITGAAIAYRAEPEDLLLTMRLADMSPEVAALGSHPGVLFGWELTVNGVRWRVRALRAAATSVPPSTPSFTLARCDPVCLQHSVLEGGIGTGGSEVRVSVPTAPLGLASGGSFSGVRAYTAVGDAAAGVHNLDALDLAPAPVPGLSLSLGVGPLEAPPEAIPFVTTGLQGGRFAFSTDGSEPRRVWARTCVGARCDLRAVATVGR